MNAAVQYFRDYRLRPVLGALTPELQERVCAFWLREGALPDAAMAARRVRQVVYVVENAAAEIAGVSTAYIAVAPRLGRRFYFYRTFMREQDRRPRLPRLVLQLTYELLRERRPANGPLGMMIAGENPKLARRGTHRLLEKLGWEYLGLNPRGQPTWIKLF